MKNIHDFLGIFIETSEMENAIKRADSEAILFVHTQLNALYIYQKETAKALEISYIWLYQFQNNHECGSTLEEGIVEITGKKRQYLYFLPNVSCQHQIGGGTGYDSSYFKKGEYAYGDASKKYYILINNELGFKNAQRKEVFQRVKTQTESREWYFAKNETEILAEIELTHKNIQAGEWNKTIEAYVKSAYGSGRNISEIAQSIYSEGWDEQKIKQILDK